MGLFIYGGLWLYVMAVRIRALIFVVLFSLTASPIIISVQGHTASSFTVLVRENGFSQTSPDIIQNDSIIWYNVDNESNLTHRLVYDYDGDGLYNGTFDWDSGELNSYCETDENNSKIDSNCSTSFMVVFDMNWTVGNYSYQDIRSDGSIVNATIKLFADNGNHMEANLPNIGSTFGAFEDEGDETSQSDEELTPEKMLLYVGLFTGISSVLLLALLIIRKANHEDLGNKIYESE